MSVLLVTYDLKKPGQDYKEFWSTIKSYSWARLSESSYAIETSQSAQTVFNTLREFIDQNDHVYVVPLSGTAVGHGPKAVNQWLSDRGL